MNPTLVCQTMSCKNEATRRIIKSDGKPSLRCQSCYDKRLKALKGVKK